MHICPLTSALLPAGRAAFSHKKNKPYLPVGFPQAKAAKKVASLTAFIYITIHIVSCSYTPPSQRYTQLSLCINMKEKKMFI